MTSHWVHSASNECGKDQIGKRSPAAEINHGRIKD
uniref:Uncharacterized protein n=1 Tax=Rhizophora mucronata TaxID=61149 RepID=A0A2P2QI40_RHIMU